MQQGGSCDNETIVEHSQPPHEAPPLEQRQAIADELRQYFAWIDERVTQIPEYEQQDIVDEAIRSVRPRYRSALRIAQDSKFVILVTV
jgi:hypothetical protein